MKDNNLHIASFEQDEHDIPPILRANIMHPDIYYYYRYLNYLMQQKGLLDTDGAVVYPGIGADISTVDTLFGNREIIGFDSAGLSDKHGDNLASRYNIKQLQGLLSGMNNPSLPFNKKIFLKDYYEGDSKRKNGGYYTYNLENNYNGINLLGELLGLGIPSENINISEGSTQGVKFIQFSFTDNVYSDIIIYQVDALDEKNRDFINTIIEEKNCKYYIEKSGEDMLSRDTKLKKAQVSIPLDIMNYRKNTKALCVGGRPNVNIEEKIVGNFIKLDKISTKDRLKNIQNMIYLELSKHLSTKNKRKFGDYRRNIHIFYQKQK